MVELFEIDPMLEGPASYQRTEGTIYLTSLPHSIIAVFTGNQWGKTAWAAWQYVLRVLGIHPVEEKNRLVRHVRCLSSCQPEEDPEAAPNMQYHELLKFMPPDLIVDRPTARNKVLKVRSHIEGGYSYFEFVSWNQDIQKLAGVQRSSAWIDEEAPKAYREECRRRIIAEQGDEIITLTPKNGLSYLYDEVWLQKNSLYRSKAVADYMNKPQLENCPTGDPNIACAQMATDDNPTMTKEQVDANFIGEDKDQIEISRYGIFSQATGNIVKAFNREVHVIPYGHYFPNDIPYGWAHGRGIDYHHSRIPWSIGWLSASPDDEWFLWQESHPGTDGARARTTKEIAKSIIRKSKDYYYILNLIDPLANEKQVNTLTSTTDDLNFHFYDFWENHGMGSQCYWEGWDTKGKKGREEIHLRLKNALDVKKPFNNKYREHGETKTLPTLWICDTCPKFITSLQRWGFGEWATTQAKFANDKKETPKQKYSHDNMVLEGLAKDHRLKIFDDISYKHVGTPSITGRGRMREVARA